MTFLQTSPGYEPILVEGVLDAPPARAFQAWVEPHKVQQWFGSSSGKLRDARIDLRVGGEWRFILSGNPAQTTYFGGEYLVIEPGAKLAFTWRFVTERSDGTRDASPTSMVTVTFEAHGEQQTLIRLRHENIRADDARRNVGSGWELSFGRLVSYFGQ